MVTQEQCVAALRGILLVTGLSPWALAFAGMSETAHGAFAFACHQRPVHTLHFGVQATAMVVCSRCAGIYLGIALGCVLPLPTRWFRHGRELLIAAIVINFCDAMGRWLGVWGIHHTARILVGALLGWILAAFALGHLTRSRVATVLDPK